nr:MAG TPA: hypothetical protein [Caudoviricetes sp.]
MYTKEQREGICKWCREYNYDKCTTCTLPTVPAWKAEEVNNITGELENA